MKIEQRGLFLIAEFDRGMRIPAIHDRLSGVGHTTTIAQIFGRLIQRLTPA